ncbi:MAG: hypothetical protein QOC92_3959 [Acidimicrobiaceae bacterium]
MERANVNGVELEYEVRGSGEPVLLIHGALIAAAMAPLLAEQALPDRDQLIRYHRRGVGGSTHTPAPVRVADQAADAAGLLADLGIDRAHVAGHSYGGAIALQLAVDTPGAVQSLALMEPGLLTVPSGEAFFARLGPCLAAYGAGDREEATLGFLSIVAGLDREAVRTVVEATVPGGIEQAIKDADMFFSIELGALGEWAFGPDQAAAISQPVLSALGAESETVFVDGRPLLHSWFAKTEDFTLDGAGHLLQMQRPQAMAKGLADFFARHPLPADA